jgi:hypothetical protein
VYSGLSNKDDCFPFFFGMFRKILCILSFGNSRSIVQDLGVVVEPPEYMRFKWPSKRKNNALRQIEHQAKFALATDMMSNNKK